MEKREPLNTVGGNVNCCSQCGNSMEFPQKDKDKTAIWSSNYTTWYISKENKNSNSKRYVYPNVQRSIIYDKQDMEKT